MMLLRLSGLGNPWSSQNAAQHDRVVFEKAFSISSDSAATLLNLTIGQGHVRRAPTLRTLSMAR